MKKKKAYFPRPILRSLVNDIQKLVGDHDGRLFILEIFEEIPHDLRPLLVENLSSFYEPAMSDFFYLLKAEYGKEIDSVCNRALEKYSLSGIPINPVQFFKGTFYKAYATPSRHTSRIALDVAWHTENQGLHVECFYLSYNSDGLYNFLLVEDMPVKQYERDREDLAEMIPVSYNEVCYLISQAYELNVRNMTRPALGKFLYQKYLGNEKALNAREEWELFNRLSPRLGPRQLVNAFFRVWREKDWSYISYITSGEFLAQLMPLFSVSMQLIEGQVEEVYASRTDARVYSRTVSLQERECYKEELVFYLTRKNGHGWEISQGERLSRENVNALSEVNPLNTKVFCRVYEIIDLDDLFETLERIDNMRQVEELPYGIHMRVTYEEDDFNQGVTMLTGVIADLIVNGEELVIVTSDFPTLMDFHHLLMCDAEESVSSRGEYEVNMLTVYSYLSGQYLYFEDVIAAEEDDLMPEDGMRFITTRYLIKERDQVMARINQLKNMQVDISDNYQVFYQFEKTGNPQSFMAEYLLGSSWVEVSAFGENDMSKARKIFETGLYNCLEYDGMEIREGGLFNILTPELKKEQPELEALLKEFYLNKWYYSHLTSLSGMSPSEASQTEEGTRLLWTMFKQIKQKENAVGNRNQQFRIHLKEYVRTVEQKKRRK